MTGHIHTQTAVEVGGVFIRWRRRLCCLRYRGRHRRQCSGQGCQPLPRHYW